MPKSEISTKSLHSRDFVSKCEPQIEQTQGAKGFLQLPQNALCLLAFFLCRPFLFLFFSLETPLHKRQETRGNKREKEEEEEENTDKQKRRQEEEEQVRTKKRKKNKKEKRNKKK